MQKIVALLILVIPAVLAGVGVKLMRDSMFGVLNDPFTMIAVQFIVGLVLSIAGIWFIGGYILHREQKNKRAAERFQKKENTTVDKD
ncbi:DUF2627 domain-containing protein [Salinicoccus sp. YB14-2]|uniref:DUF2627 domain-containing protein n=1 Tax=Salinicoccus sp. YB14-2 TaxID=1572701 RepID=UPI000691234F|nr:DUF2627 domain-containing protein [Salinicoccus sp. YB14-2]